MGIHGVGVGLRFVNVEGRTVYCLSSRISLPGPDEYSVLYFIYAISPLHGCQPKTGKVKTI